jgi:hypothetical protein
MAALSAGNQRSEIFTLPASLGMHAVAGVGPRC